MKYANLDLGTIEAVVNKLGGMDGVCSFLSGGTVVKEAEHVFAVWKTIKLGTGLQNADAFRRATKARGCRISDWASDILGKPAFSASETETDIDLVVVSIAELGFKNGATGKNIYKRAIQLGLELCSAEVGPQLRLQYMDQPMNECLLICMKPITDSHGDLGVFLVERYDDGLWLGCNRGRLDDFWRGGLRLVFLRRK